MEEENEAQISNLSTVATEETEDQTLIFLDSLDDYLILIQTLSSTLRQGWLELASARHSMGASRVNTALLSLKHRSAATKVELDYHDNAKSPQFSLCKWTSTDDKNSSPEKEKVEEDEQLKENMSGLESESSLESSKGSETTASPRKTENLKERAKILSMFGTLVSPKLRASQLSFETALETLVNIANVRSSILEAHAALVKDTKNTKE
ncbi:coiled-coil domain-containing protein 115 isoform X2 [Helianthus annuus]|uniref:coiled-coil domain-containing protein 115 isoform X2 n=1 Tax=Helianthus annuus TaxID=4232 RepID=UPI000B90665D|nr:coiled-coil domain-containing protein 115 isoform X2 [Helianthus annuus]